MSIQPEGDEKGRCPENDPSIGRAFAWPAPLASSMTATKLPPTL